MKNDEALSRFLVENAHEAIIDKVTFEKVQERKEHIKQTVQME